MKLKIEYLDFVIKSNTKSNLFSLYRKIQRKKRNSDELYPFESDVLSNVSFERCIENIITILVSEESNEKSLKLNEFFNSYVNQRNKLLIHIKENIINKIYNYDNIMIIYFKSESELTSYKFYLGKKIINNSEIIYEGLESNCSIDIDIYNNLFFDKDDIYSIDRYLLIIKRNQ